MDEQETSSVQLTVEQAARTGGVSTKTIRRWLTSGRLAARRDGAAYAIDRAELERAMSNGHPADAHPVPSRGHGLAASMSIVQELLDRLERQAGEIVALRLERDQLAVQVRALQAPQADSPEMASGGPRNGLVSEMTHGPSETQQRPWWRLW